MILTPFSCRSKKPLHLLTPAFCVQYKCASLGFHLRSIDPAVAMGIYYLSAQQGPNTINDLLPRLLHLNKKEL